MFLAHHISPLFFLASFISSTRALIKTGKPTKVAKGASFTATSASNCAVAGSERLAEYAMEKAKEGKTFEFKLIEGDTNETLTDKPVADLVFIDGGHSYKTVSHDYHQLMHNKVVVLDDYFSKDDNDNWPEEEHRGVNKLWTEEIKEREDANVYVIPSNDPVKGGGFTHLGLVS